jgi:hypothetical protein
VLQGRDSDPNPGQGFPPLDGSGLLQKRNRDWIPPPQVVLQSP